MRFALNIDLKVNFHKYTDLTRTQLNDDLTLLH